MWSYRGEKTNLSPGVFSLNIWMLPLHLLLISPLFVNDALLDSNVLKKQNKTRTGKPLCLQPPGKCVHRSQESHGETCAPYLGVLRRILCMGYLFYVSVLDSFDTDPCQVDLAL